MDVPSLVSLPIQVGRALSMKLKPGNTNFSRSYSKPISVINVAASPSVAFGWVVVVLPKNDK